MIVRQETSINDVWSANITPNDGNADGTSFGSNNISFNSFTCTAYNQGFILDNNLTSNGTCLSVNASNILIDGNGYYLTGNKSGYGINLSGVVNVTIKNFGGIRNFSIGISIEENSSKETNHTLINNIISTSNVTNSYGIFLNNTKLNNITNNTITSFIKGIGLILSDNNSFLSNIITTINNTEAYSIFLNTSNNNTFNNDKTNSKNSEEIYIDSNSTENKLIHVALQNRINITTNYIKGVYMEFNGTSLSDPSNKDNLGDFLTINNLSSSSYINFNLSYTNNDIINVNENTVRMHKYDGSAWTELTSSGINAADNVVSSGNITTFSLFAPFGNLSVCVDLHPESSNDYYIDVNSVCGQCDNDGPGNITTPWCSLNRTFSITKSMNFTGGDKVYIKNGTYRISEIDFAPIGNQLIDNQISGNSVNQTLISGYPGHNPVLTMSELITNWTSYTTRADASIYYFNWSRYVANNHNWIFTYVTFVPQLVAITDEESIVLMQEVNSIKNGYHDASSAEEAFNDSWSSFRTNHSDMIAGDFYYESNSTNPDYGLLFIWMPDSSDPNNRSIEVSLDRRMAFGNQDYLHFKNFSVRYASASTGGPIGVSGLYNRFENIDSSYNAWSGIEGTCHYCVLKDNKLRWNGNRGSSLTGNNTLFENNIIERNNQRHYNVNWHAGGIKIAQNVYNMTMRGNVFAYNNGSGLWFDYASTSDSGHIIEKNTFYGNTVHAIHMEVTSGKEGRPIIIRNNIIYSNGPQNENTIDFRKGGIFIATSHYNSIYNNIIYNSASGIEMHGISNASGADPERTNLTNNTAYNNLFYNVTFPILIMRQIGGTIVQNNTADYNLFYNVGPTESLVLNRSLIYFCRDDCGNKVYRYAFTDWKNLGLNFDNNSLANNPLLINISAFDFNLTSSSPAIDEGITISDVTDDFEGDSRPQGSGYDIGPDEYAVSATTTILGGSPGTRTAVSEKKKENKKPVIKKIAAENEKEEEKEKEAPMPIEQEEQAAVQEYKKENILQNILNNILGLIENKLSEKVMKSIAIIPIMFIAGIFYLITHYNSLGRIIRKILTKFK